MPCRCNVNTLRLFIRSVAQVELPSSSGVTISRSSTANQIRKTVRLGSTGPQEICFQRAYSTTSTSNNPIPIDEINTSESLEPHATPKRWPQSKQVNAESPFVELSLDSIKELAAESVSRKDIPRHDHYETPLKSLLKELPKTKDESRTVWRKLEPGNIARKPRSNYNTEYDSDSISISSKSKEDDDEWIPPKREQWMIQKAALKEKFPDGYKPQKRLSPDAMAGIRALHAQMPDKFTTEVLSKEFAVSPEAIRRILKSKWRPTAEEETDREQRWFKRGQKVWSRYAELGLKTPKRWRELGIGKARPDWMNKRKKIEFEFPPLVTTARRTDGVQGSGKDNDSKTAPSSLADRIL